MRIRLKIEPEKCSGCRLCEMACSIHHLGVVNTGRSAIRVFKDDLGTGACKPVVCRQCKKMLCMDNDHPDAELYRDRFVWEKSFAESCPFDALVEYDEDVYHCDLCGGKVQCVSVCSTGAIRVVKERSREKGQRSKVKGQRRKEKGERRKVKGGNCSCRAALCLLYPWKPKRPTLSTIV